MKPLPQLRRIGRHASLGLVLLICAFGTATSQRTAEASRGWRALYPPEIGQATTAERAAMMATMEEVEHILSQRPEIAQPRGFEVMKQVFGGTLPFGKQGLLAANFFLWFFAPSRAIAAGEGPKCIEVNINTPLGSNMVDEAGRPLSVEREIGDRKPGATVVYEGLRWDMPNADRRSGYVMFTSGGKSPWIPVTREQYLRALILQADGKGGKNEASRRKAFEKTGYELWMEEAAERKKNREDAIAAMARNQGRVAADELRKSMEQTERDVTEQLKAQEAEDRKRNQELQATPSQGDELRAELAALSPAERNSPAMVDASGPLVASDHPRARRVVTLDPEFWRVRRSRAEVHSITIGFHPGMTCGAPAVHEALAQTYESLDWAQFKRIVDQLR